MNLPYQNGFLVQHRHDFPYAMEEVINTCGYSGLDSRNADPLSVLTDRESRELSREVQFREISEQAYVMQAFIRDPDVLLRYIRACREHDIPIRVLFVESDYGEERWTGPAIPKTFLGYEYNTIPVDNQIITDLCWYAPLAAFLQRLNSHGLFSALDRVMGFKEAYDRAFARGEIGDGDMQTHIFCLYEVQPEDALRYLADR